MKNEILFQLNTYEIVNFMKFVVVFLFNIMNDIKKIIHYNCVKLIFNFVLQ